MANIHLALSGGGFRATIFHLGVLRFFKDRNVIKDVKAVAAVSGGAINAADLVLNWDRYVHNDAQLFRGREEAIRKLTQAGIRNRLTSRIPWYWLSRKLRLNRDYTLTDRLAGFYSEYLFEGKTLNDLKQRVKSQDAPFPMFVTTSLSQPTDMCFFSPEGFGRIGQKGEPLQKVGCDAYPIANAVAASSAFPVLFPPVEFSANKIAMKATDFGVPTRHYLTDGGVFENTGLTALLWRGKSSTDQESPTLILSNAGRQIDWDFDTPYKRTQLLTLLRTSLIAQYWAEQRLVQQAPAGTLMINIWDTVDSPPAPPTQVQHQAAGIRTDFDSFSDLEWNLLFDHGYSLAEKILGPLFPAMKN